MSKNFCRWHRKFSFLFDLFLFLKNVEYEYVTLCSTKTNESRSTFKETVRTYLQAIPANVYVLTKVKVF